MNTYVLRNYYKTDGDEARRSLIGNIFLTTQGISVTFGLLEFLAFPFLIKHFGVQIPYYPFFVLAILNNILENFATIPMVVYRLQEKARTFVTINVSKTLLQFIGTYLLLTHTSLGVLSVYISRIVVNFVYVFVYSVVIRKYGKWKVNIPQIKEALHFSLPLLPGAISYIFIASFDRVMLEHYLPLTALGIYSTAATISMTLSIVEQGLYRTFEQRIFKEHGTPQYGKRVMLLYRLFIVAVYFAGGLIALFSRELFLLFTSQKYMAAALLVPWLVVPAMISGMNTFLGTLVIAENKRTLVTKATLISAIITLVGDVLLIRWLGVAGAIVTSFLAFGFVYLYYQTHVHLEKKILLPQLFFILIIIGTPMLPALQTSNIIVSLAVKTILGGAYLVIFVWLSGLNIKKIEYS